MALRNRQQICTNGSQHGRGGCWQDCNNLVSCGKIQVLFHSIIRLCDSKTHSIINVRFPKVEILFELIPLSCKWGPCLEGTPGHLSQTIPYPASDTPFAGTRGWVCLIRSPEPNHAKAFLTQPQILHLLEHVAGSV